MKFRLEWLASYLPGPAPGARELGDRLTAVGFIFEGLEGEGKEAVLDVEVTPNRPDAMNHRGLAREAAVALGRTFADPEAGRAVAEGAISAERLASVTIEEPASCSRYSARVIEGIAVRPCGSGVGERLLALGSDPISAPVDATNHVLWDIGQPLHAFDLDTLSKGQDGRPAIVVRRARDGERLVTLDGMERTLSPEHLVIADAQRPVALAGVMGGLETAISPRTTRVLLESAHFDPGVVRRTARAFGMHTDASHRFERGTDPAATVDGLDRAARLLVADCGGSVARGVIDVVARAIPRRSLALSLSRLAAFLGMEVGAERCAAILAALGFAPVPKGDEVAVTVPSWRVDVEGEVDLFEEVIRVVGYDRLPETLPRLHVPAASSPGLELEDKVRDRLVSAGFVETQTYSFVSEEENAPFASLAPGAPAALENPLGEPFTTLRATPLIGLLKSAQHNVRRGNRDLALFEVGHAFGRRPGGVAESPRVAILLHGRRTAHFSQSPRVSDLYDGSGAVAALFTGLGAPAPTFRPADLPILAAGRAAEVFTPDGVRAGWVGVLEPALAAAWDLQDPVVAEVELSKVSPGEPPTSIEAPSRFPGSEVDLTVTHRVLFPFQGLEAAVREGAPGELRGVDAKVRYQGPGVPEGFVKTTLTLRFGSATRSLAREEVNAWRVAAALRLLGLGETRVDGIPGEGGNA